MAENRSFGLSGNPMDYAAGVINPWGFLGGITYGDKSLSGLAGDMIFGKPDQKYDQSRMDNLLAQRPEFSSILGSNGQLQDQYKINAQPWMDQIKGVQYDSSGLDALKARALATGDSPWAALQRQQNEMARQDNMGRVGTQANSALAQARSGLAMRGGLSGGAGASLARQNMRDAMAARQGINRQDMQNQLAVGIKDQEMKDQFLSQLPGAQAQAFGLQLGQAESAAKLGYGADEFNLQNTLGQISDKRNFDMQNWLKEMEVEAANRQAVATENAGKK